MSIEEVWLGVQEFAFLSQFPRDADDIDTEAGTHHPLSNETKSKHFRYTLRAVIYLARFYDKVVLNIVQFFLICMLNNLEGTVEGIERETGYIREELGLG